jgi:hypothetical protein
MANAMRTIKAQFSDISVQVGTVFLPVVEKAVGFVAKNLPSAFGAASKALGDLVRAAPTKAVAGAVADFGQAIGGIATSLSGFGSEAITSVGHLAHLFDLGLKGGEIGGSFSAIERAIFSLGETLAKAKENLAAGHDVLGSLTRLFDLGLSGGSVGGQRSPAEAAAFNIGKAIREDLIPALKELQDVGAKEGGQTFLQSFRQSITDSETWANVTRGLRTEFELLGAAFVLVEKVAAPIGKLADRLGIDEVLVDMLRRAADVMGKLLANLALGAVPGLAFIEMLGKMRSVFDDVVGAGTKLIDPVLPTLQSLFSGLAGFVSSAIQPAKDLYQALLKLTEIQLPDLGKLPGGGFIKKAIGQLSGRALGGPVFAGMPYVVGERGQELFVPDRPGQIIPTNQITNNQQRSLNIYGNVIVQNLAGSPLDILLARP